MMLDDKKFGAKSVWMELFFPPPHILSQIVCVAIGHTPILDVDMLAFEFSFCNRM